MPSGNSRSGGIMDLSGGFVLFLAAMIDNNQLMSLRTTLVSVIFLLFSFSTFAQEKQVGNVSAKARQSKAKEGKARNPGLKKLPMAFPPVGLKRDGVQIDFPAPVQASDGTVYLAHLEWQGKGDSLHLAKRTAEGIAPLAEITESGVLHAPSLAADHSGNLWCFWPETNLKEDTVGIFAKEWDGDQFGPKIVISVTDSSEAFVDSGTDSDGRIWVVWQSMRSGEADIYAKHLSPDSGEWSNEFHVSNSKAAGGNWEPRISFDQKGNAWILYDGSRGNEFNLYLSCVSASGEVFEHPIAHSDRYEARGSIVPTADGSGFWIAAERGRVRWGLDARGHDNLTGINAQKEILFGEFDIEAASFTETPLGAAGQAGQPVNLPVVGIDGSGKPWVAYRYFSRVLWQVAITCYDPEVQTWGSPHVVPGASFGQDRRSCFLQNLKGDLLFVWSSDQRKTKAHQEAGVFLTRIRKGQELPAAAPSAKAVLVADESFAPSQSTPERAAEDRHVWEVGGKKLQLYWGDLHRHTDVSNCRTGFDGCIAEHFRYAYDIAKLDFLGTSDHTDIGKIYHPYEWWHNQRMHDAFHSEGRFTTLYVYEREQKWPWGHRNVVFPKRGGPIVYINRNNYRESPWQKTLPIPAGIGEINPPELWEILKRYEQPVALISHTGATRMGTDWSKYERFDHTNEGIVEIFQGARVSYEAEGAPQPTVGLKPLEKYTINGAKVADEFLPPLAIDDFGEFKAGTFQNALELGLKLGVFASSDHIAQHVSYGGVFCESFTREGLVEGFNSRATIAATDKIYLSFTCNDAMLGSIIETEEEARLCVKVDGTGKLNRVTLIRNEKDWKVFDQIPGKLFETELVDSEMLEGENRYYVRVEQADGNMAWTSPIWVTLTGN